jgi:hypothetical protein
MSKKHDIHDQYGGKVGELRKQSKLLGDGYDIHDRYGGKVGELVPIPSIPSSVYVVIGIVLLVGFVISFLIKTITGITDTIGRSVPWVILYSIIAGYLWVWWYRSTHGKPMPLLRTTVAFIGLVFIGSSQQLFPKLRPYLEHIPNILFILGSIWLGLPLILLILAFLDVRRFRSHNK